jgi:hypothetical protein
MMRGAAGFGLELPDVAALRFDLVRPPNAAGLEKAAADARHLPHNGALRSSCRHHLELERSALLAPDRG